MRRYSLVIKDVEYLKTKWFYLFRLILLCDFDTRIIPTQLMKQLTVQGNNIYESENVKR